MNVHDPMVHSVQECAQRRLTLAGTHVRCSDHVHRRLKDIGKEEGVSLSQALEILVSTLPPEGGELRPGRLAHGARSGNGLPAHPGASEFSKEEWEALSPEDQEFWDELAFPESSSSEPELGHLTDRLNHAAERVLGPVVSRLERFLDALDSRGADDHQHGGDPECAECESFRYSALLQSRNQGEMKGMTEMRDYLYQIPQVKYLYDMWEQAKARLEQARSEGEDLITIEG